MWTLLFRSLLIFFLSISQIAASNNPHKSIPGTHSADSVDATPIPAGSTDSDRLLADRTRLLQTISAISTRRGPPSAYHAAMGLKPLDLTYDSIWQRMQAGFELTQINHPAIDKQINFLRRGMRSLSSNLHSARPFLFFILEEIDSAGMPIDLALLPLIESAFDPSARSSQNALGLWQFMPATAQTVGLKVDQWYDGRLDPVASTYAAIRYLKRLHTAFDGDWLLALAAYNAGPGNVHAAIKKARKRGLNPVFWNLKLPDETRNYVPRLIAATRMVENPELYGLTLPDIANQQQLETLSVGRRISLSQAAIFANTTAEELRPLNLAYISGITPPEGPHQLNVPVEQVQPLMDALSQNKRPALVGKLVTRNYSSPRTRVVPDSSHPVQNSNSLPYQQAKPYKAYRYKSHTVQRGDTLWSLSRAMGVDVDQLISWNNLPSEDTKLKLGSTLKVAYIAKEQTTPAKTLKYRVANHDTLRSVAHRFNLRVHEVKKWNPSLWHKNHLRPGQTLRIPYTK